MRLHRFYISNPITSNTFDIADHELIHQWKHVFRYNVGSQVIVFDGSGTDFMCMISSLRNLGATLSVISKNHTEKDSRKDVWLCMSLIKKDNFELVTQKATEIGVSHIIPILSERTEKKKINEERLRVISIEASEQSGRGGVPELSTIQSLVDVLTNDSLPLNKIVFNPTGKSFSDFKKDGFSFPIALFIGPEGGWSDAEMALFKAHGVESVALGSTILRAETAAIAAVSLLLI